MPLSEDQKAMLRLLAQREQGYDDLAALMGLSVEEVRAKVKDALDQLEAEGKAAPPPPAEPAPAPEEPPRPEPVERARVQPPPPEPATTERHERAPKPPPPSRPSLPRPSLPADRGIRAAIAAGAGVLVVIVVLLATGALGGDSGGGSSATSPSETEGASTTASSKQPTQAVLSPVGGGNARGAAVFGRVKNSLALQIEAQGLAPTGKGQSYTIWLAQSPRRMLPLASTQVGGAGTIGVQVAVPAEVLTFLAKGTFDQISVTRTSDSTLKASLAKATVEEKAPIYTGTEVLRGKITGPIVGAANK